MSLSIACSRDPRTWRPCQWDAATPGWAKNLRHSLGYAEGSARGLYPAVCSALSDWSSSWAASPPSESSESSSSGSDSDSSVSVSESDVVPFLPPDSDPNPVLVLIPGPGPVSVSDPEYGSPCSLVTRHSSDTRLALIGIHKFLQHGYPACP
jgi:hypothetical protein